MKQVFTLKEPESKISTSRDIFLNIIKMDIEFKQENTLLFCLNTKNQILHSEVLFKGGLNTCIVDPKTIFRVALKYNSNSIIIAHNHPSGSLIPSIEDTEMFNNLKNCGNILKLKCLDSIIFNPKEFYSMEEC